MHSEIKLFTGNANPALAAAIAEYLEMPVGRAKVGRFSDGEINVENCRQRSRTRRLFDPADLFAGQ